MISISNCGGLLVDLTLSSPPSWNAVYKPGRGHIYMTKEGKEWKAMAVANIKTQCHVARVETYLGKVFISYRVYLNSVRCSDLDNRLKLTNDVLQSAGVIANDNQIFAMRAAKYKCHKNEQRVELSIHEYID